MNVVSNTSPLLFLSKVDALPLLVACFGRIHVPTAVVKEVRGLALPDFIVPHILPAQGIGFVKEARGRLHRGELETIYLGIELAADYILLDDLVARRKAARMGLKPMGTIGVLLLAHRQGYITGSRVNRYIDTLVDEHNMYLSNKIIHKIRQWVASV